MFNRYLKEVTSKYASGHATEHSYRPALQELLTSLFKDVQVTNEPKRQACGAPDYILTRKGIPFGYIEAKDITVDLNKVEKGSKDDTQWQRYSQSLDNLILTDYLEFRFFVNGEKVETVVIGQRHGSTITPLPENFDRLATLLRDFGLFQGQTIKSARKLAEMMAHKAALMRDVFLKAVQAEEDSSLKQQLAAFKEVLMHDMDAAQFADVYAQTIAYGLFTARLHDETLEDFSRAEALTLIPKSNPFLRQLFQYVAGADLDDRVVWIVDALCEVYRACDLRHILKDFGTGTGRSDPILHFYETFLSAYDAGLRKDRGVWYTPEPVVRFIVRAVDDVLKTHFKLKDGLADTSKIKIKVDGHAKGKSVKIEQEVHKVQVLDVATGTGTFLAEVIRQIHTRFKGQEGMWSSYVDSHLLPRLHGFELLMASYAMCHMKLDLLLQQTGYKPTKVQERLGVYLTNSLEEHHKDSHLPFVNWLSQEANAASRIKREMPIMVAIGNPPYSGESDNKGDWIMGLMEAYKKEPGGKVKLKEKNPKWLNNDYVKFIRLGEHYINKNGEGVLAYITDNSYLDNPTFRGMRWHLMNSFDDIYVLDLHGNSNKKEKLADGTADKNVFDIQQGVAIIIAIKRANSEKVNVSKNQKLATVSHAEIMGSRDQKFKQLDDQVFLKNFLEISPVAPSYFFLPRNTDIWSEYSAGFSIGDAMPVNNVGIVTARDDLTIHENAKAVEETVTRFITLSPEEARSEFSLGPDARDWQVQLAQADLKQSGPDMEKNIKQMTYRPFDTRWTYYTGNSKGFHCFPRDGVMRHMLAGQNVAMLVQKQPHEEAGGFVSKHIAGHKAYGAYNINYVFPLYVYEKIGDLEERRPNFEQKTWAAIRNSVKDATPEGVFNFIYAVLHSRAYRTRYAEYLKSDFPRIPYPKNAATFHQLAALGAQLRALHLMESERLEKLITSYPVSGDHLVDKTRWEAGKNGLGRVYINATQHFDGVPQAAWEFFIGGYQPAQKWLKDRKGRSLTLDDIRHWQRIIVALTETSRLMDEIDQIKFLPQ